MRVLVISTSYHDDSTSQRLAEAFADGAREAGHHVDYVTLRGKTILPCHACYRCSSNGHRCVMDDDAPAIVDLLARADAVCWATPVYYYEMAGQMKTLLDRTVPLFGLPASFRRVYLLISAGEDSEAIIPRVQAGLLGWVECFEGLELRGTVFTGGEHGPDSPSDLRAIAEARAMGAAMP